MEERELNRLGRELDELGDLMAYAPSLSSAGRASMLAECRAFEARIERLRKSANPIDSLCV
jgi:hypothetical protein